MAILSSDHTYVTVERGDTLSEIALDYRSYSGNKTYQQLATLNNISNANLIYVGQKIKLTGSQTTSSTNVSSKAVIEHFGLQADTDRTVFATWTWDRSDTDHYSYKWQYDTGDGVWFDGSLSDTTSKQSTYNAPANAKKVRFLVKPVSKTRTVNGSQTSYWTADWSTAKEYSFSSNPPSKPSVPSVEIENLKLTAELSNLNVNGTEIQFQIVKDNSTVFKTGTAKIVTNHAAYSCSVDPGSEYKVRCRAVRDSLYSDWTEYSSNVGTPPSAPTGITVIKANSKTSVYLEWSSVSNATKYDLEYTNKKEYFDGSDSTTLVQNIEFTHYEKTGLETGKEYFFRVRAINDDGESSWSEPKSVKIGTKPVSPTTWSSTTTAVTGEPLNLYWVHNSEDGSSQTVAELEITINGDATVYTIQNQRSEEDRDKTSVYSINTLTYIEGTKLLWRVRTAGVTEEYGDWSIQRTVDIYTPPTLVLEVLDNIGGDLSILESFPFYIRATAGPNTQTPLGYHISITSNSAYETVDNLGNTKYVNEGEAVYSKYFDISTTLLVEMSAFNVNLENNIEYTVKCSVTMNSGLTVDSESIFSVAWTDVLYTPNAEIGIEVAPCSAYIRPYCEDENGNVLRNMSLSVYRREFDGSFTEIATGLANTKNAFVTDPHPSLDYARYRVVAIDDATGSVNYCDIPGYPVGEKAVILQWNETWSDFDVNADDQRAEPVWSGSLLRLPYNIDVSNRNNVDVSLINYAGREHPVSYYGTALGEAATWNMSVPKRDKDTLYALRRLASWAGDVYVREPSGSGYWASVNVTFSQKHCDPVIPVSLEITRVEGGI